MKPKKYLTALFYSVQTPFGVWAGIEFSENNMIIAWVLIAVMMILEAIAVFFWMCFKPIKGNCLMKSLASGISIS